MSLKRCIDGGGGALEISSFRLQSLYFSEVWYLHLGVSVFSLVHLSHLIFMSQGLHTRHLFTFSNIPFIGDVEK